MVHQDFKFVVKLIMDVKVVNVFGSDLELHSDGSVYILPRKYITTKRRMKISDEAFPRIRVPLGNNKRKEVQVARLLCKAFNGDPPSKTSVVKYHDGNRFNLNVSNLYWSKPTEKAICINHMKRVGYGWMLRHSKVLTQYKERCGVYFIKDLVNGMYYVGSSKDLSKRLETHMKQLSNGTHFNSHLQNCFNKHGEENFVFKVFMRVDMIDGFDPKVLCGFEEDLIDILGGLEGGKLFNFKTPESFKFSEELKRKISALCSGEKNGNYGKRHKWSEVTKELARMKGWRG